MSQATITEKTEYGIKYPDGTIKELEFYMSGEDEYARVGNGLSVRILRADGLITPDHINAINQKLDDIHDANLRGIRAAKADPFEYPQVEARRVLTITDPWAAPTNR